MQVLDAIEERRAGIFIGVPAMYRMLLEAGAEDRDLTQHPGVGRRRRRHAVGARRPVQEDGRHRHAAGRRPVGEAMFFEGYGMVELGGGAAAKISPPFLDVGLGSDAFGFPLPGYQFQVIDPDTGERPRRRARAASC